MLTSVLPAPTFLSTTLCLEVSSDAAENILLSLPLIPGLCTTDTSTLSHMTTVAMKSNPKLIGMLSLNYFDIVTVRENLDSCTTTKDTKT